MTHILKIETKYLDAVISGIKTFEIRNNDRNFQVGDLVLLTDNVKAEDEGRSLTKKICYITDFAQQEGYVVFGMCDVGRKI